MPETLFCYCCRVHHPRDRMHSFRTRHGFRWRCEQSIAAAKRSVDERDAFGKQQSEVNREAGQRLADRFPIWSEGLPLR